MAELVDVTAADRFKTGIDCVGPPRTLVLTEIDGVVEVSVDEMV